MPSSRDQEGQQGQQPDTGSEGLTCVGYSEIDKYAIQIYQKHFKEHKYYGDCTQIKWDDVENFDVLVGGFPCQSFSIAGKRKGFDDTRGTLFFEIARCIKEKRPRILVLENVKGLLSHDKGSTFATILTTLDELGYDAQWQVLNSKYFGVPQNRERVFIIGHLRGTSRSEVFPLGICSTESKNVRREVQEVQCASTLRARDYKDGYQNLIRIGGLYDTDTRRRQAGSIYSDKGISPPLDTAQGGNRQPIISDDIKIRRLTPTECERLQGFPDGWTEGLSDTQRYKCLGNAVTTNVITAIFKQLTRS
jgi:DNA (cytosine-5)-methyltransferase 1